jgi:hypothetical protein
MGAHAMQQVAGAHTGDQNGSTLRASWSAALLAAPKVLRPLVGSRLRPPMILEVRRHDPLTLCPAGYIWGTHHHRPATSGRPLAGKGV